MNRRAELDSLVPERDNAGCVPEPRDWSRALAPLRAIEEGLTRSPAHWQVSDSVRAWYPDTGSVPGARRVIQHQAAANGDKRAARRVLHAPFPHGYGQQACRIAGMRTSLKRTLDV
ncbi:MAG: TusE/DsrC/DsvC family sulfur relay protein [Thiobacillus sp.]